MNGFWDWSVLVYAKPGVPSACLNLQDDGGDIVPLLLWAAWLVITHRTLDAELATQGLDLAQQWSDTVISPLRSLRRRLKSPISPADEAQRLPLREKIKALELNSERALMEILAGLSPPVKAEYYDTNQSLTAMVLTALRQVSKTDSSKGSILALTALAEALTKP